MKKLLLIFLLPLFSFCLTEKLDEDNGFANYKFGTSPQEYKNLEIEIDEGKTQLYSSTDNNNIKVNGTKIKYVRITFCKNQLAAITLETEKSSGTAFLNYLKEKYGQPKKVKTHFEWLSKNVQLIYEPLDGNDAEVYFYSREIYEQHKLIKK